MTTQTWFIRVRIGSSTFTAIQGSAGDGQTKGVSETLCIFTTCINEARFYEHVKAKINSSTFPSHAIVFSDYVFLLCHVEACSRRVSHAACIALDLGAASLRTHEAAKEDEVHR